MSSSSLFKPLFAESLRSHDSLVTNSELVSDAVFRAVSTVLHRNQVKKPILVLQEQLKLVSYENSSLVVQLLSSDALAEPNFLDGWQAIAASIAGNMLDTPGLESSIIGVITCFFNDVFSTLWPTSKVPSPVLYNRLVTVLGCSELADSIHLAFLQAFKGP